MTWERSPKEAIKRNKQIMLLDTPKISIVWSTKGSVWLYQRRPMGGCGLYSLLLGKIHIMWYTGHDSQLH